MNKITFLELETLRKRISVNVHKEHKEILEKLFRIGEANLKENGVELIVKLKILRGFSNKEICEICGVRVEDLEKAIDKGKITKAMALKLTKLGFPIESFLKIKN